MRKPFDEHGRIVARLLEQRRARELPEHDGAERGIRGDDLGHRNRRHAGDDRQEAGLAVDERGRVGMALFALAHDEDVVDLECDVVVDNRPGMDGVVGTQAFVAAKDTHALLFAPAGSITFAPYLHEQLPYDPTADVVPISSAGTVTLTIAVATTVKAAALAELVALVRQRPGAYYWSTGSPGGPELALKALIAQEQLQVQQVRYRDTSIALQDVGAGRVHIILGSLPTVSPLVEAGSVRLLAVTNTIRSDAAPSVPTDFNRSCMLPVSELPVPVHARCLA